MPGPNTLGSNSSVFTPSRISPRKPSEQSLTPSVINSIYKGIKSATPTKLLPKINSAPISKIGASTDDFNYAKSKYSSEIADAPAQNEGTFEPPQGFVKFWSPISLPEKNQETTRKSFNFTRIADNLSPPKAKQVESFADTQVTYSFSGAEAFFDNIMPKSEAQLKPIMSVAIDRVSPLHINVEAPPSTTIPTISASLAQDSSEDSVEMQISNSDADKLPKTTKFLRPTSLPLKIGTFTPKRHHGITPTANTLPLISPETPRPSKHCVQLYLNGHAYTYLGLKCSTKTFYCTVNRPQPVHFTNQHKLSIYSNWQICAENSPHPLGLTPKDSMSLYDSRQQHSQHTGIYTTSGKTKCTTLHSQSLICASADSILASEESKNAVALNECVSENGVIKAHNWEKTDDNGSTSAQKVELVKKNGSLTMSAQGVAMVPGGYESNEDYTYIRGRGRGRYVCSECGIRCKKPSMLKKHIRTHSNVRPYTCQQCAFRYTKFEFFSNFFSF